MRLEDLLFVPKPLVILGALANSTTNGNTSAALLCLESALSGLKWTASPDNYWPSQQDRKNRAGTKGQMGGGGLLQ